MADGVSTGRHVLASGTLAGICGTGGGGGDCVGLLFVLTPKRREPKTRVNIESIREIMVSNMPLSFNSAKPGRDLDLSNSKPPPVCLCSDMAERLREAGGSAGEYSSSSSS